MVPTFLQKRRARCHSLRVHIALVGLAFLMIVYTIGVTWIIADRALTKVSKLALIGVILTTALLTSGLFQRLRR